MVNYRTSINKNEEVREKTSGIMMTYAIMKLRKRFNSLGVIKQGKHRRIYWDH